MPHALKNQHVEYALYGLRFLLQLGASLAIRLRGRAWSRQASKMERLLVSAESRVRLMWARQMQITLSGWLPLRPIAFRADRSLEGPSGNWIVTHLCASLTAADALLSHATKLRRMHRYLSMPAGWLMIESGLQGFPHEITTVAQDPLGVCATERKSQPAL